MRQYLSGAARRGGMPCVRAEDILTELFDDDEAVEFTEEEVVHLHWWLLQKVRLLSNENTPLADKLELVRWIFTDPERDTRPFSFVNCLRVVSCSPFSRLPFLGALDPQEIRDWIGGQLRGWIEASIRQYPEWVRQEVMANPAWVADCLARNPQWLNEQIRRHDPRQDLFS
ncbi:hypothetical protein [Pseudoduganella violacea]|uniref:Uncharacterized protein n=1 Tax=Pseudoduganella violacea TaxID=1715466 RepID=A0A7W5FWU2_9BURK|nr:hypothetical protein [Pseudoduganella violacea]MBB3122196.1 hypothetical protein [Pseudoduganella violacea]